MRFHWAATESLRGVRFVLMGLFYSSSIILIAADAYQPVNTQLGGGSPPSAEEATALITLPPFEEWLKMENRDGFGSVLRPPSPFLRAAKMGASKRFIIRVWIQGGLEFTVHDLVAYLQWK